MNMGYHILRLDCSTQTPTHIVDHNIDSRLDPVLGHGGTFYPSGATQDSYPVQISMESVGLAKASSGFDQFTNEGNQKCTDRGEHIPQR